MKEFDSVRAKARAEGKPEPGYPWAPNLENSWMPSGLFNAMIAPLTKFPIKGAIWYQGESNAGELSRENHRPLIYQHLYETMVRDWRRAWGWATFHSCSFNSRTSNVAPTACGLRCGKPNDKRCSWPTPAWRSPSILAIPTIFIRQTSRRSVTGLALAARAIAYGEKLEYSGPQFRSAKPDGGALRVWFDHAAGLTAKGGPLQGFEIAGPDRKFVAADAKIDGDTILVSNGTIKNPTYVRYGWAPNPQCNVYNGAGLPAPPFRSAE